MVNELTTDLNSDMENKVQSLHCGLRVYSTRYNEHNTKLLRVSVISMASDPKDPDHVELHSFKKIRTLLLITNATRIKVCHFMCTPWMCTPWIYVSSSESVVICQVREDE